MPPVTKMRVGATKNSRSDHPKTSPRAPRSSKRCIMRASCLEEYFQETCGMPQCRRPAPEEMAGKLRQVDAPASEGKSVAGAMRSIGTTPLIVGGAGQVAVWPCLGCFEERRDAQPLAQMGHNLRRERIVRTRPLIPTLPPRHARSRAPGFYTSSVVSSSSARSNSISRSKISPSSSLSSKASSMSISY
jgi:hypothetical protein